MRDELRFETVVTGYGLTETTGTVSMCRHDDPPEVIATTVGVPARRERADRGRRRGARRPGRTRGVLVRGFNVMKGYFEDPTATAEAIDAEGWLRTGDIGFLGQDGNMRITDRKKDMFIVGGFNAYPAEIEGILLGHPQWARWPWSACPTSVSARSASPSSFPVPGTRSTRRAHGLVPGPHGELQGPTVDTCRRLAPAEPDGQGDEIRLRAQLAG